MMKCFLIHGHVSQVLLLATMVPLIKNKLSDAETSDNYRLIALSSVILKIFDWIVILLFGEKLGSMTYNSAINKIAVQQCVLG